MELVLFGICIFCLHVTCKAVPDLPGLKLTAMGSKSIACNLHLHECYVRSRDLAIWVKLLTCDDVVLKWLILDAAPTNTENGPNKNSESTNSNISSFYSSEQKLNKGPCAARK